MEEKRESSGNDSGLNSRFFTKQLKKMKLLHGLLQVENSKKKSSQRPTDRRQTEEKIMKK